MSYRHAVHSNIQNIKDINSKELVVRSIRDFCQKFDSEDNFIQFLSELSKKDIRFISTEDKINIKTSTAEFILFLIQSYRANAFMIRSSNVRKGIQSAKTTGKILGRPMKRNTQKIKDLRAEGFAIRKIAKILNLSIGSVHKSLTD